MFRLLLLLLFIFCFFSVSLFCLFIFLVLRLFVWLFQFAQLNATLRNNFLCVVCATFYDFIMCFTVALSSLLPHQKMHISLRFVTWCSVVCNFLLLFCLDGVCACVRSRRKLPVRDHRTMFACYASSVAVADVAAISVLSFSLGPASFASQTSYLA